MFEVRLFIGILILSSLLVGCAKEPEVIEKSAKPRPVKLIEIEAAGQQQTAVYPAVIDAVQSSRLAFQVSGQVKSVNVVAAQEVKQGDVLIELEQRDFQNKLDSAQAQFDAAQNDYTRGQSLVDDGVISVREMDQLRSKRDVAKPQLDSAEKALSDTVLKAPFDGIVLEVPAKSLENVQAGAYAISVMGAGLMEAIINIPASIVARSNREVPPKAFVVLDAAPESQIPATFRRANLKADPSTQTYQVRFAFSPPSNLNVLPGMTASLGISFYANSATSGLAVSVPTFAILYQNEQNFVWVVDPEDMTVSKRKVTVRDGVGESLIVTSGLNPGDKIVGAGATYLAEGMAVRPWDKS